MKGLFIKDCQLLFQRKQTLILFFLICLVTGFSMDGSFIVGYMAFLSSIIALSTISYDEADNGLPFLMTLPISRKTYALSKYVLGGVFCLGGWLLSIVMMLGIHAAKSLPLEIIETIIPSLAFLLMSFLILDLMIPLQLKFGAEKSRIVMFIVFGGIAAIGAPLSWIMPSAMSSTIDSMNQIADTWYIAGGLLVCCLLTIISLAFSIQIMKKKIF